MSNDKPNIEIIRGMCTHKHLPKIFITSRFLLFTCEKSSSKEQGYKNLFITCD